MTSFARGVQVTKDLNSTHELATRTWKVRAVNRLNEGDE